ncbi:hypothetical protein [Algibacter lectus]|uniref:hypothetical protein n=1 Tax=Algibacter lectus TaxID=221126 RepID=UPI0026F37511|nr:hypothetical protein [Algibacter lectus]MDO7138279.1 hypothetical protein [Algibacter lectus]
MRRGEHKKGDALINRCFQSLRNKEKEEDSVLHKEVFRSNGERVVVFEYTLILRFLHDNGYRNYNGELISLVDNVATVVDKEKIFKFLLEFIQSFNDDVLTNAFFKQGESLILKNRGLIHGIKDLEKEPLTDSAKVGYVSYDNGVVKIDKNAIKLLKYSEIEGFVWEEQIIRRKFKFIIDYDSNINVYDRCLRNSTNNENHFLSVVSAIGNLIHKHKDQRLTKAIIINDQNLNEKDEEGGSGKGLIVKAVSKIRQTLVINGKNADPSKNRFFLQGVTLRTCLISIDDPPRNVVFEDYFSFLTDEMTVEKKHQASIVIPYKDSPKFSFTTNYSIKGNSSSHKRRRFDIFLNDYYSSEHKPTDDFGHEFFYDWDGEEWGKFDYFMVKCLQTFIKNGLILYSNSELKLKKFKNETSSDFYELMEAEYRNERKHSLPNLREKLISTYGTKYEFLHRETARLKDWVGKYSEYNGFDLEYERANFGMWFKFKINKK